MFIDIYNLFNRIPIEVDISCYKMSKSIAPLELFIVNKIIWNFRLLRKLD